jgi:ParB family chromosome partitioning protein
MEKTDPRSAGAPGVVEVWDVAQLKPNPLNPRSQVKPEDPRIQELAASIKSQRLIEPLIITPAGIIIAGHRRHIALIVAGIARCRVIVQRLSEAEQLEVMLAENLQRQELTPLEEAKAYKSLLDTYQIPINEASRRLGLTHAHIQLRLAILRLDSGTQKLFNNHEMQVSAVQHLLKIKDPDRQQRLATMVLRRGMTIKKLGTVVDRSLGETSPGGRPKSVQKWMLGVPRQDAVDMLAQSPQRSITFAQLRELAEALCCACGMSNTKEVCLACPIPQFIKSIALGVQKNK